MADQSKLEQMLEKLVNNDREGADSLFHEFVIEKSRSIYEKMLEDEAKDLEVDEATDEEVDEATDEEETNEATDEEVDEASSEEETNEATDEETTEATDEEAETFAEEQTSGLASANYGSLAEGGMPTGEPRRNKAGIMELDYRKEGGFVPIGIKEKADDVPAMLSRNEFVFTADAVRGAGDGDIDKGAQRLYNTMKTLENGGTV